MLYIRAQLSLQFCKIVHNNQNCLTFITLVYNVLVIDFKQVIKTYQWGHEYLKIIVDPLVEPSSRTNKS